MKRTASVILLFIFLFNTIGYYSLFLILNSENKAEIAQMMQSGQHLETVRIHKSELKNVVFTEGEEEFSYKGEMYDVKEISAEGDYVIFYCISDHTEKQLLAGLQTHEKNNTDPNSSPGKKPNNSLKNTDLFLHQITLTPDKSSAFVFPSALCHFISYIPPTLPLPPPETSIS